MAHISAGQRAHLAALLSTLRPDWGRAGVEEALYKASQRADVYALSVAAIRAAATPTNRTPGVIPLDGAHWREPNADPRTEPTPIPDRLDAAQLAADRARAADPAVVAEQAARIRAVFAERRRDPVVLP